MSLRRAEPADALAIGELSRAAYAKWVPVIGCEPLPMTADYDQAVRRHLIDLYEEGGELHALIEMVVETGHLVIENIAVRPDQQGKGIGDQLVRHAEAVASRVGAGITPPRLSQNRTCGPRIRLLGSVYQNTSDCWADAVGELRSCQRVCSETIRPVNQDGG